MESCSCNKKAGAGEPATRHDRIFTEIPGRFSEGTSPTPLEKAIFPAVASVADAGEQRRLASKKLYLMGIMGEPLKNDQNEKIGCAARSCAKKKEDELLHTNKRYWTLVGILLGTILFLAHACQH
jgi:hypothetical protein